MRKLIAGMKLSVDGKIEGPEGYADWVEGWSDDYGLTSQIDACLLEANMYRGYEQYSLVFFWSVSICQRGLMSQLISTRRGGS
jgi:hypothetical protein